MMGRNKMEEGESSTKTCKSDGSTGRPLRKARYLWQIKGKYHMKKSENVPDENKDTTKCSPTEMLDNCATKCLNAPSSMMKEENNNGAFSQQAKSSALSESKANKEIAERVLRRQKKLCEKRLRKWQARQMAWCYFDNTINSVMEQSGIRDKEGLLGNFHRRRAQRRRLENSAVMMAIYSHGLQRTVLPGDLANNQVSFNYSPADVSESGTLDMHVSKEQDNSSVSDSDVSCRSMDSENTTPQTMHLSLPNRLPVLEDQSDSLMEHTDFMDKAVAVAIQKKGLSTFSNMEHN